MGDKADGVPGIPRWGMKSASTLLAHYKTLEAIPDDEEEWQVKVRGAKGLAEQLRMARQEADLYKVLTTLRLDVPIKESLKDLQWQGENSELWADFSERANF